MPKAKGLFHKAAIQSGANLHLRPLAEAVKATEGFLELAGVRPDRLHELQEMRSDVLNNAWIMLNRGGNTPGGDQSCPVVDGKTIPAHPFDPVAPPTAANVPVIVGTNKDETTLFLATDNLTGRTIEYDEEKMRQTIVARMGDWWVNKKVAVERVDDLIATYRRTRPEATPAELTIAITTDQWRVASIRLAERQAAGGTAPVYMYLFTWESKAAYGRLKSAHGFEIPFVFNHADLPIRLFRDAPERFRLAAEMSGAWAAFARSGNPDHAGIPHWPAYDAKDRATMIFGKETHIENDPASEERKAWEGIVW
jgi:para-nitrobenzyl esterase